MARILVHALAATAGGGANYLRQLLTHVASAGAGDHWLVLLPHDTAIGADLGPNVELIRRCARIHPLRRVYMDQIWLRRLIQSKQIDAILATGNFGIVRPPVPQILLNRNALYFNADHLKSLWRRGDVRELLTTIMRHRMALASIKSSAANIVPTAAFADEILRWSPSLSPDRFQTIPHGFDHEHFVRPDAELAPEIAEHLDPRPGVKRILMVSHYNYFRNFETLLRAFAILRTSRPEPLELVLTTKLGTGVRDHRYDTSHAARLIAELRIGDAVTMLGTVPHNQLYPLYQQADVVVCPSYAETFGHPMVEAMASGKPVVASDLPVHREVCQKSAIYFSVFDPDCLAKRIWQLLEMPELARDLAEHGKRRSQDFSWRRHFEQIVATIHQVLESEETRWRRQSA